MKLSKNILIKMIKAATQSRPDEIGCGKCYDQLHEFAELKLKGKSPEEAMPLVQDHLNRCRECRQEYEGLIEALEALKATA